MILILILCTISTTFATTKFHENLNTEDLQHYFGTQSLDDVPDYEIIHPIHVSGSRHRRSIHGPKPPLKYELDALGEKYNLHLNHNDVLVAPGCLASYLDSEEVIVPCPTKETDCFYHGVSIDHKNSTVAVSTCMGLHGIVSTASHDLLIQPIRKQNILPGPEPSLAVPHLVYKRSPTNEKRCNLQAVADAIVESASSRRMRRSTGKLTIEMLLVADKTMYNYHGNDLTRYMLTAANLASVLLQAPSLGMKIHLAIVRIKILKTDRPGLAISTDAQATLSSFCLWQEKFNPASDTAPTHADAASLMTRIDIQYLGVQSTTGLASLGQMCVKNLRCSVVQDTGLDIGLILAHETGHSLSLQHDGEANGCLNKKNIMSTSGGGGETAFQWSSCSAKYLSNFLEKGQGSCLLDEPLTKINLPKDLPGVIYSGHKQCELFLGKGWTIYKGLPPKVKPGMDVCSKLACRRGGEGAGIEVIGSENPRMDGTECGDRKWCQSGRCVDIGPNGPKPQNGGWSDYTKWTTCSRTCGGGVRYRSRTCNNPRPRFGGKDCVGSSTKAELCNLQACSSSQFTFMKEQCAATNNEPVKGQYYNWTPESSTTTNCRLSCEEDRTHSIYLRSLNGSTYYKDGTECHSAGSAFGRCVQGKCLVFGCDGVSDSRLTSDKCGVCNGKGDTCKKITGTYTKGEAKKFVTFLTLPKGATGVKVTNKNAYCYMSVSVGGTRVFNKVAGMKDMSGTYSLGSVQVKYRMSQSFLPEKVEIVGKLTTAVEVQVYRSFGDGYQGVNPEISYEYYIPKGSSSGTTYTWKTRDGACSTTCGEGVVQEEVRCVESHSGATVADFNCDLTSKPISAGGKKCSLSTCPARWRAGSFSLCSKTCGGGSQTRAVECTRGVQVAYDGECQGTKPTSQRVCNTFGCPGEWRTAAWSACSKTCSEGVQTRSATCYLYNQQVADDKCLRTDKPSTAQKCHIADCKQNSNCSNSNCSNSNCKDLANCQAYGTSACTQYADWTKINCKKFCGHCVTSTASTSSTAAAVDPSCVDVKDNCAAFDTSACSQYKDWAQLNCKKFCGFCATSKTSTSTTASTTTVDPNCVDVKDNCVAYGTSACSQYKDWAQLNCKKFCGFCATIKTSTSTTASTTTVDPNCVDVKDNCVAYGTSACSQYKDWAQLNCKKFCGFCATSKTSTSTTASTTTVDPNCVDVKDNCVAYGTSTCSQYQPWAKINCKKFCGFCSSHLTR